MEGSILVENQHHGNSNFASKSVESSIKIDSISIDLINASEKSEAKNCEHFSIRGYVSQIRKKDWKRCSPFASDGGNDEVQTSLLPPMDVPKFRFWHCQNCLQEIGAKGATKDYGPTLKFWATGFKSNSICFHTPIVDEVETMPSDFQQAPALDVLEIGKAEAKASDMNKTNECHPSSCIDKKDQKNAAENGDIIVSEENLNQDIHRLTRVASDVNPRLSRNIYHTNEIDLISKCNRTIDLCKLDDNGICHEVAEVEFSGNLNNMSMNAGKICEAGKGTSADYQCEELVACGTTGEAGNVKEARNTDKVHTSGHIPLELDECDNASSESADITTGNKIQDFQHDNSSGLQRKKIRKVRLLTELLCENGDGDNNQVKTDGYPLNAVPDASELIDRLPTPQSQVAVQGNARKCLGHNRKRKFHLEEDCKPLETTSPNKPSKAVKTLMGDAEFKDADADSESEEDASVAFSSQTGMKKHWTKRRTDSSPIIGRKKNKKPLMFDECLPLVPSRENMSTKSGNKVRDAANVNAADGFLLKSGNSAFASREIDFFALPAQRIEINPCLNNMKGKMPQFHDQNSSLIPLNHGMLSEGLMERKNVDITQSGPIIVSFRSAEDAAGENGLNLSLNSYEAAQGYDKKHIPEVEDKQTPLLSWQGGTFGDQVMRNAAEIKDVEHFSFTSKRVADTPFGKVIQYDLSGKKPSYGISFLNEKQNFTSQIESAGRSLLQQKEFCSTSGKETIFGNQEHLALTRKDNDHRVDKRSEQGTLDDIPMEIVELMAKNQYERCLADAEFEKRRLQTRNDARNGQTVDFARVYEHRELNLFQQETSQKRKPVHRNERNGIIKRDDNVRHNKQKSVDYFFRADQNQFNMGQLEQTHSPAGFGVIVQCQEMPSTGVQHPAASSSSRQTSGQNCKWIGDLSGKRLCRSSLQPYGPCNTCQSIPLLSKESNHLWSSSMPNRLPFGYSIPQKCAAPPNNMDVFTHVPGGMHKENMIRDRDLKFLNQNLSFIGKQNMDFNTEPLGRVCAQYPFACKQINQKPMGSLDLYSNETIPAMHLLSLMDAGLRSNAPMDLDTTPKFLKRPTTHDHGPKDFSRLEDAMAYKTTNAMKHPLYDYHSKNQAAENSRERIPLIPNISSVPTPAGTSAFTSSFQNDKSLKKAINFSARITQEKEKRKDSSSLTQNKGFRSQKSASTSGNFGTKCGSIPVHGMQTMFLGPSDSMVFPLQYHPLENSIKRKPEAPNATGTVNPNKSSCRTEVCSLNRNPSDFSVPEPGNVHMIAGEDLKFRKVAPPANEPGSMKLDGRKRQRKHPAAKEHGRHLIS